MQAGELTERVRIMRAVPRRTESGAEVQDFELWFECWAAVEPLSARELYAARQVQSLATARIRIRYRRGLDATMRVEHRREAGSPSIFDSYDIDGPPLETLRRQELTLMAVKRDAEGFRSATASHGEGWPGDTDPEPGSDFNLTTESGDSLITESGDAIVTEDAP